MAEVGASEFQKIAQQTPVTQNGAQREFVECVAKAITAQIPGGVRWDVKVFESKEVNAFALPGAKIGVFTGLLKIATTQDQLAAVLGHEVSHVLAHHSAERYSQQVTASVGSTIVGVLLGVDPNLINGAAGIVVLKFSRTQESEADLLGLDLMSKAGFDPNGAVELWKKMAALSGSKSLELLSTHPADATRIKQIEARIPQDLPVYRNAEAAGLQPRCVRPG